MPEDQQPGALLAGAELSRLELGATFVKPVVVPAASPAIVGFTATVTAVDDGRATLALVAEADGQKVLGRPRAVVRVAP